MTVDNGLVFVVAQLRKMIYIYIYIWGGLKVQYDGISCMLVIKVGYTYLQPLDGHFECIIQRTST